MKEELLQFSLTTSQAASFVPVLEGEIAAIGAKQSEASGALKKVEREYQKQKKITDELTMLVKEKQVLLGNILKRIGNDKSVKRLMRATSHTAAKKEGSGRIRWGSEFVNILKKEQRFITYEEFMQAYSKKHNIDITQSQYRKKLWQQVHNFRMGDLSIRKRLKEGGTISHNSVPVLIYGKKYFGLVEWFDLYKDGTLTPKPPYMKQFIYQNKEAV